jgi:hypothetical protein
MKGEPGDVVGAYRNLLFNQQQQGRAQLSPSPADVSGEGTRSLRYGDGSSKLLDFGLLDASGRRTDTLESGDPCTLFMNVRFDQTFSAMSCGFAIKDRLGTVLYGVTNRSQNMPAQQVNQGDVMTITAKLKMWLAAGEYYVNLGVANFETDAKSDFIEDGIHFTVLGPRGIFTTSVVNLETEFSMTSNEGGDVCNPGQPDTVTIS